MLHRLPSLLLLLACALPVLASDLEREARWAEEVADSVLTGDVEYLDADGHRFMAIYTPTEDTPPKGGVIVVHGSGVHPNWPDVVYPLRTRLPARDVAGAPLADDAFRLPVLGCGGE